MSYTLVKLIHIGSLVFWLGPALGSWLVLKYSQKKTGEYSEATSLIYKIFFFTLTLEHVALACVLSTGLILGFYFGHWPAEWLQWKLLIILVVIIPLEIVDIWLGNWKVKRLVESRILGETLSSKEQALINFYHSKFTTFAIAVLPISIAAIMWLAIAKVV